jgi:hypothetical protein
MEGSPILDYQYQKLPNKKDKRILVLKPAAHFYEPLECHLEYRPWLPDRLQKEEEALEKFVEAKRKYEQHFRQWEHARTAYNTLLDGLSTQTDTQRRPLAKRLLEVNYERVRLINSLYTSRSC